MLKTISTRLFYAFLVLILASLACSVGAQAEPTATPEPPATSTPLPTSTPIPTNTPEPTSTPRPTKTPNVAATQAHEKMMAEIQGFVDEGYITSGDGELVSLEDHYREMAKINYLTFNETGYDGLIQNFVFFGDVAWESAGPVNYPEYSGCGFAYRVKDGLGFYTALLTNDSVYMSYCDESTKMCGRLGTTRGSGTLDFGNPAKASMTLVVSEDHAYVLVDGEFIGEYTLFKDKLREPGFVLYGMISGTNRDFGTSCAVTNPTLWVLDQ